MTRTNPPPASPVPRAPDSTRHNAQPTRGVLVHRDGAEATLPEMPGFVLSRIDGPGIRAVHLRERAPQAIRAGRHQDQVHMVRHQAPRPEADIGGAAMLDQEVFVERIVLRR